MKEHYVCTNSGCRHYWTFEGTKNDRLGDGRTRQRTYIGGYVGGTPHGRATCLCCVDKGAALPIDDGTECAPIPCDTFMGRCPSCLATNGQHVINCADQPTPPRDDVFLAA